MTTHTTENYLKTIFNLSIDCKEVFITDVAKSLGVSMPTVNSMIKKLHDGKFIKYQKYKPLKLSKKGKTEAALIVRKHRLIEMFLVKFLHLGWEHVHDIAEEMEHIKSKIFFEKLEQILNNPKTDPHGSPIPDKDGNIEKLKLIPLIDCKKGQTLVFKALADSGTDFIKFLNNKGLSLGTKIKIIDIENFDDSLIISYKKHQATLSAVVCKKILVEPL